MAFSGGAGSSSPTAGAAIPVVTTGPTTVPDRPDAPPERYREARTEADEVSRQLLEETFNQQMRGQAPSLKASTIRDLRARLIAQFQLSERQATRVINESLSNNLVPGRDAPDVQNAVAGRETPAAAQQSGADANAGGQQQQSGGGLARESRGAGLARMQSGKQATPTPSATPAPRTPTPPPQQVAASPTPPPPVPGAPMPRADGTNGMPQPLVADGTPQPEAVVVTQDGSSLEGQPLVPRQPGPTDQTGIPRRPLGRDGQVTYFVWASNDGGRGSAVPIERRQEAETLAARFRLSQNGGQFQSPPPAQGAVVPRDTFQGILRDGDSALASSDSPSSSDRDRGLGLGYGRSSAASLLRRGRARDGFGGSGSGFA